MPNRRITLDVQQDDPEGAGEGYQTGLCSIQVQAEGMDLQELTEMLLVAYVDVATQMIQTHDTDTASTRSQANMRLHQYLVAAIERGNQARRDLIRDLERKSG